MKRIGWENGVLVSKGKVSIGGNIYEVEPEQYEGNTPLSAENLKKMEDNMEEAVAEVVTKGENAKGAYIKFVDGTMIQHGYSFGIDNDARLITYPVAFNSIPTVCCNTTIYDSNYIHLTEVFNIQETSFKVAVRYCSSSGGAWGIGSNYFNWIAIGRWK